MSDGRVPHGRAALTIEITQGIEGAQPIAVVPFGWNGPGQPPQDVAGIIAGDLKRSGQFSPLASSDFISQPHDNDTIQFHDWRLLGAPNLVVGTVRPEGMGYRVLFRLYDIYKETQLIGYSIPSTPPSCVTQPIISAI